MHCTHGGSWDKDKFRITPNHSPCLRFSYECLNENEHSISRYAILVVQNQLLWNYDIRFLLPEKVQHYLPYSFSLCLFYGSMMKKENASFKCRIHRKQLTKINAFGLNNWNIFKQNQREKGKINVSTWNWLCLTHNLMEMITLS